MRKEAQPLIDAFGEMTVRNLFSKTWQNRDQAIEEIENIVLNERSLGSEEAFTNSVGALRYTVADKMSAVGQKAMHLFSAVTQSFPNVNLTGAFRNQFNTYTDLIMANLADKIGDNLQKVRSSAEDALLSAAGHKEFGIRMALTYVTSDKPAQ